MILAASAVAIVIRDELDEARAVRALFHGWAIGIERQAGFIFKLCDLADRSFRFCVISALL